MLKKYIFLILFFISILPAQDWLQPAYGVWGIGLSARNRNYIHTRTEITPGVFIFGGYGPVFIEGNRIGYNFYGNGTYFASLAVQIRTHQFRRDDENGGLRKRGLEAGLHVGRRLPLGVNARIAFLHDISKTHGGWEAELQLYRAAHFGKLRLLSAVSLQLQNRALVNYYYGTKTYQPQKALGLELEIIATYKWQNWAVFGGTRIYTFDRNVSGSPLAQSGFINQLFTGIGYYF